MSVTFPVRHAHAHDPKTSLIRGARRVPTDEPAFPTDEPPFPTSRARPKTVNSQHRDVCAPALPAPLDARYMHGSSAGRAASHSSRRAHNADERTVPPCTFPVRHVLLLRGGAPTTPPVASRKKESDTKEIMIAGVKLSNLPAALRAELMTHGLEYLSWMYTTVFTVFSLRMYCTACSDSRIKSAIPSLVVLALLWRLSDRTMSNFKSDPHASNDRPKIALDIRHHI